MMGVQIASCKGAIFREKDIPGMSDDTAMSCGKWLNRLRCRLGCGSGCAVMRPFCQITLTTCSHFDAIGIRYHMRNKFAVKFVCVKENSGGKVHSSRRQSRLSGLDFVTHLLRLFNVSNPVGD